MVIKNIPVSKINPAIYNPRKDLKPGDKEYEKLKSSIQTFGYVDPIVWNEATGNLVGGHQRFKILMEANPKEIMASVVNLDPIKEKALNIALNKVGGDWDEEALGALLIELEDSEADLDMTGFDDKEIEKLFKKLGQKAEKIEPEVEFSPELHEAHNYVVLYFDNDIDWLTAQEVFNLKMVTDQMHQKLGARAKGLGCILQGGKWLQRLAGQ